MKMAKLLWKIDRPEYGHQFNVEANTRADAIAKAEAQWLADTAWEAELVGAVDEETGVPFTRTPVPTFVASKLGRASGSQPTI